MNYADTRDSEQLRQLGIDITQFATDWKAAAQNGNCPRQNVFFFPGGMASRLLRAHQPYQEGVGVPANVVEDGTDVQRCPAPDTQKRLTRLEAPKDA